MRLLLTRVLLHLLVRLRSLGAYGFEPQSPHLSRFG